MLGKLRVLELAEGIAGPIAGVRLGDLGADVVKIESTRGDWMRHAAPVMPETKMAAAFFELNRGKQSLALGPSVAGASTLLNRLVELADVVITDRSDSELDALGIREPLREGTSGNPGLIVVDISPWGRSGPMADQKGSELTAQAMAGYTRYLGRRGEPALRMGADAASVSAGMFATQAILAALLWCRRGGGGQRVSVSLFNSLLTMKSIHIAAQADPDVYSGPRVGGAHNPPEHGWKTADNPIFFTFGGSVGATGRPGWLTFVEHMGLRDLADDPRFDKTGRNSTGHGPKAHELRPEYEREFVKRPAAEIVDEIQALNGSASAYMTNAEALAHPQTAELAIVQSVALDSERAAKVRAFPARFSRSAPDIKGIAPSLGEQTEKIILDAGFTRHDIAAWRQSGALLKR